MKITKYQSINTPQCKSDLIRCELAALPTNRLHTACSCHAMSVFAVIVVAGRDETATHLKLPTDGSKHYRE